MKRVQSTWYVVRGSWFVVGGSWLVVRGWWFVVGKNKQAISEQGAPAASGDQ